MEEKLKASDSQSGDSEVRLFERCQELQALVQEKEEVITQLGQQLEEQVKGALTHKEQYMSYQRVFFPWFFRKQNNRGLQLLIQVNTDK